MNESITYAAPGARVGMVRTVPGDVPAADLGVCYAHEHLILDSILISSAHAHILLDDADVTTREVTECAAAGVRAMVDAMPAASGRDAVRLAEVSRRTPWHAYEGTPGLAWLRTDFPTVLRDLGLDGSLIDDLYVANPARLLGLRAGH